MTITQIIKKFSIFAEFIKFLNAFYVKIIFPRNPYNQINESGEFKEINILLVCFMLYFNETSFPDQFKKSILLAL